MMKHLFFQLENKQVDTDGTSAASTYTDVRTGSLILVLLKLRQRFRRKEADIFEVVC